MSSAASSSRAVANRNDCIEVEVLQAMADLARAFATNRFHFGNSCLSRQFTAEIDALQVFGNCGLLHRKKTGYCSCANHRQRGNLGLHSLEVGIDLSQRARRLVDVEVAVEVDLVADAR